MNCAIHSDQEIVGACARCGNFVCALDSRVETEALLCLPCAARAFDHLESLRQEFWGKRHRAAYLVGLGSITSLLRFGLALWATGKGWLAGGLAGALPGGVLCLLCLADAVVCGAFFLGKPAARAGLVATSLLGVVLLVALRSTGDLSALVGTSVIWLLGSLELLTNIRTKLFFRLEVTRAELLLLWDTLRDNPAAESAVSCGFVGLFLPGVALAGLAYALVALSRVNPDATPPIGRRKQALLGLGLSLLGCLVWGTVLAAVLLA